MLGDHEGASGLDFGDGIADRGVIRNRFPIGLAVAAGGLRAALDYVAGDDSGGELVPFVGLPSEAVNHRCKRQRGVGAAASDDDIRARGQSFRQRKRAQVGIRAVDARANRAERRAGIHVAHRMACR